MLKEPLLFGEINQHLSILHISIRQKGIVGFHDDKIACENLFIGIFNIIYGLNLINLNTSIQKNYPAVDLGDKEKGICYQITFENKKKKIDETKVKYYLHEIANEYPTLRIFIFDKKPPNRKHDDTVQYFDTLTQNIQVLTLENKEKLLTFLNKYCVYFREVKKSQEIQTIQAIIKYISERPTSTETQNNVTKPYPLEKLKLRFGKFKHCIEEEFSALYPKYHQILTTAKSNLVDEGNSEKIKLYLNRCSRETLFDCKNNSREALDKVVNNIIKSINIEYFDTMIRFYILSELMECDIFPLTKKEEEEILRRADGVA